MAQASRYPECCHILTSGHTCQSPALRGQPLCHYHSRGRTLVEANRARKHSVALPPLDDRHALQLSLDEVLAAFAARKITRREAGTYLYALDLASRNFARMEQLPPPDPVQLSNSEPGELRAADPEAPPLDPQPPETADLQAGETQAAETLDPISAQALLPGGRDTHDTHEFDPEPPLPLTQTQLRDKRRQIERDLRNCREGRRYWASGPTDSPGTDPAVVLLYLDQNIAKLESELQALTQQATPDPPWDGCPGLDVETWETTSRKPQSSGAPSNAQSHRALGGRPRWALS